MILLVRLFILCGVFQLIKQRNPTSRFLRWPHYENRWRVQEICPFYSGIWFGNVSSSSALAATIRFTSSSNSFYLAFHFQIQYFDCKQSIFSIVYIFIYKLFANIFLVQKSNHFTQKSLTLKNIELKLFYLNFSLYLSDAKPKLCILEDIINFLKELNENNNREWFAQNKSRYERVRSKFEKNQSFTHRRNFSFRQWHQECRCKDCVFRIYRDIRFDRQNTYKTHFGDICFRRWTEKPAWWLLSASRSGRLFHCCRRVVSST